VNIDCISLHSLPLARLHTSKALTLAFSYLEIFYLQYAKFHLDLCRNVELGLTNHWKSFKYCSPILANFSCKSY